MNDDIDSLVAALVGDPPPGSVPLKQAILDRVLRNNYVSFAELDRRVPGFKQEREHGQLVFNTDPNIILWVNMSREAVDAVCELLDEGKIEFGSAHWMTYMADGMMLQLPMVKRRPKGGFKTPHWMPIVLNIPGTMEKKKGKRRDGRSLRQGTGNHS